MDVSSEPSSPRDFDSGSWGGSFSIDPTCHSLQTEPTLAFNSLYSGSEYHISDFIEPPMIESPPSLIDSVSSTSSAPEGNPVASEDSEPMPLVLSNIGKQERKRVAPEDLQAKSIKKQKIPCSYSEWDKDFTKNCDLRRHIKYTHKCGHFTCGCCINQGIEPRIGREDKVVEHLRKKHGLGKEKGRPICESLDCKNLIFASKACLALHLEKTHSPDGSALFDFDSSRLDKTSGVTCLCVRQIGPKITNPASSASINLVPRWPMAAWQSSDMQAERFSSANSMSSYHPDWLEPWYLCSSICIRTSTNRIRRPVSSATMFDGVIDIPSCFLQPASYFLDQRCHEDAGGIISLPSIREFKLDVETAYFYQLYLSEVFTKVRHALMVDLVEEQCLRCITYNAKNRSLALRGNGNNLSVAVELLRSSLASVSGSQRNGVSPNHSEETSQRAMSGVLYRDGSEGKIFAFDARVHSREFDFWMNVLILELPHVLDKLAGNGYSVRLIMFGPDSIDAEPHIQVQTPLTLGVQTKKSIVGRVKSMYDHHTGPFIRIVFTNGSFVRLAKSSKYTSADGKDNAHSLFSYHRPWAQPGMGIAIGMGCSNDVSGTLGGFLEINGKLCILTAAHTVDEAQKESKNGTTGEDKKSLISPPQDILEILRGWVGYQDQEHKARMENAVMNISNQMRANHGNEDISPEDLDNSSHTMREEARRLEQFREDVRSNPKEIGKCKHNKYEKVKSGALGRLQGNKVKEQYPIEMDYAIHKALVQGSNRHRYRSQDDALADTEIGRPDLQRIISEGELCDETCDPDTSAVEVYYVGRTSGHRACILSTAPELRYDRGSPKIAYFLVDPKGDVKREEVEGDSGAWIIRTHDNKVLGQLVGLNGTLLTFIPINDIIDHIKQFTNETVCLPKVPREAPSSPAHRIMTLSYTRRPSEQRGFQLPIPPPSPNFAITSDLTPARSRSHSSATESVGPSTRDLVDAPGSCEDIRVSDAEYGDGSRPSLVDGSQQEPIRQLVEIGDSVASALAVENHLTDTVSSKKVNKHDLNYILDDTWKRHATKITLSWWRRPRVATTYLFRLGTVSSVRT